MATRGPSSHIECPPPRRFGCELIAAAFFGSGESPDAEKLLRGLSRPPAAANHLDLP